MKEVLSTIFFLAIAGSALWGWNRWQQTARDARNTQPSINALAMESSVSTPESKEAPEEPAPATEEKKPEVASSGTPKETLNVKVLNGGAAKGNAGKVQDFLKKNGYNKVQIGNTIGDYTGVVVYYLDSNEASATAIQKLLVSDFPEAEVRAASASDKEGGSAPVVVILGK
ncbi:MAG: LytR C-terminal domain-containing protein [Candidatus Moranbacteria bacterium]|nr:LytR C-terminal domain-containing protein [Candidatus Moranbacteria bacterium]